MARLATQETNLSVSAFLDEIRNDDKRNDAKAIVELMHDVTGDEPKVWGNNFIIGFGKYTYTRKGSKEELEWFKVGFAPRKDKLTLYLTCDIAQYEHLLDKLGKHKHGKGCLYIKKLADVDVKVLKELIEANKEARWD